MQTEQSCCGAFTVAVGIIGLMTAKEGQTDVNNMEGYRMIAELTDFMLGFYGTLHCVELQKLEIVGGENPCHAIVEALAQKRPNFRVIFADSVKQWIVAADQIFIWMSTAIAEVYFAGKSCRILRPVPIEHEYDPVIYKGADHITDYAAFAAAADAPSPSRTTRFSTPCAPARRWKPSSPNRPARRRSLRRSSCMKTA